MGGFFGVVSGTDCVSDLFYGTDYHSHLGTRRGGMAVTSREGYIVRKIHDITNAQFRSKFENVRRELNGCCGIGVISDFEDQPLLIASHLGQYAIVSVSKINNVKEIVEKDFKNFPIHFSELCDGEMNPTELIAALINQKESFEAGLQYAMESIDGSCSVLIISGDRLIAARDRFGRTPISVAKRSQDGAMAVAMETSAFPNLDFTFQRNLAPGEIVELSKKGLKVLHSGTSMCQICSFFWVYFGYPSSDFEGTNTESARYRNGQSIARDDDVSEIDSVCGIPDSGVAHAIGYSNASGKPYMRALVKYTPTWPRSFMPQDQNERKRVAHMKLIPVEDQIRGKRLLFCDDSVVRGTQFRDIAKRLFERGAKAVHLRSASPPIMYPCKFLNFSRSRSTLDLAARRAVETLEGKTVDDPVILKKYTTCGTPEYNAMVALIQKELGLNSLKYQKLENLIEAIGLPKEMICTYCYDGCDPTAECPCKKGK